MRISPFERCLLCLLCFRVQVTRPDGSWTYGKIMEYDSSGDTYSVMTRAGAKHFVERSELTDDIVVNPSDGSCAQQ